MLISVYNFGSNNNICTISGYSSEEVKLHQETELNKIFVSSCHMVGQQDVLLSLVLENTFAHKTVQALDIRTESVFLSTTIAHTRQTVVKLDIDMFFKTSTFK